MCPAVNVQPNFDMESYLGTWYELYRSNDIPKYNESGECTTAHYSAKHGDNIKVENTSQDVNPDGTYEARVEKSPGEASFQDPEEKNGHLKSILANMDKLGIPYEEWDDAAMRRISKKWTSSSQ